LESPSIQYARTSDGISVACMDLGAGEPIVFASNIFGDAHLYRRGWPHVKGITDALHRRG
jgi:hypothetical protein